MTGRTLLNGCQAVLFMVVLNACGGGGGGGDGDDFSDIPVTTTDFAFSLSSEQVIAGTPAAGSASGSASFQTQARGNVEILASGSVSLSGIEATSVGIYEGFAGEAGPLLLELQQSSSTTWTIPADTELDVDELRRLEQSGFYVLASGPQGQLRGQILPEGWSVTMFGLSGDQVVPGVDTAAFGKGGIAVQTESGTGRFSYHVRVTLSDGVDVVAADLAEAFAGANGSVIAQLQRSTSSADVWGTGDVNNPDFVPIFTAAGLETLLSGAYYVLVATAANPTGEIRGQLLPEGVKLYAVSLSPDEVVGPGVVTSTASASAFATYRLETAELTINLQTASPTASGVSLHQAPFGENGPLLFSLFSGVAAPDIWSLATTALPADRQAALEAHELYLSVTSPDFPEGELRGQIIVGADEPMISATVGANGGKLLLHDPAGSEFELTLPAHALLDETVITMERAELPDGFPPGIRPLSAVSLGPDGTTFSAAPTLTVDGVSAEVAGGARAGYIVNGDGTIEYTPLLGSDPIAAALSEEAGSFSVPHFSLAGPVEIDPESDGIPEPDSNLSAEAKARQRLADHATHTANLQILGLPAEIDPELIDAALGDWARDLDRQFDQLVPTTLNSFSDFTEEVLRYNQVSQSFGADQTFGTQYAGTLFSELKRHLTDLDNACLSGDPSAFNRMLTWLDVASGAIGIKSVATESSKVTANCLFDVVASTDQVLATVQGDEDLEVSATLLGPGGADITNTVAAKLLGFRWEILEGLNEAEGSSLFLDTSFVGLRKAKVAFDFFTADEVAAAIIVPDHRGTRQIGPSGTATGCDDPEDNGELLGNTLFEASFGFQSVTAIDESTAMTSFSGSGSFGDVAINSIDVSVTYDNVTETEVAGSATGSISFTLTEIDEDTGEIIVTNGSINLNTGTATDVFNFPSVTGSDSAGCTLSGEIGIA